MHLTYVFAVLILRRLQVFETCCDLGLIEIHVRQLLCLVSQGKLFRIPVGKGFQS
jgi:hypothetical protein